MLPPLVAQQVEDAVLDYLETTFSFSDEAFRAPLFAFLRDREQGLFRGPYADVRLPYRKATPADVIPLDLELPYPPYLHQLRAYERLTSKDAHAPRSTLVVTGTGSGKTECFLHPILDHCARHAGEPGVKAILLYPMNALASDQARRLAKLLAEHARLKEKVTAGLYVGGKGKKKTAGPAHLVDDRDVLRRSPPDILLTNYKMLDFLLLRPQDAPLWVGNTPETLRYIVLDELHTYDGAQGSDVACLLRRLKARLGIRAGALACVGTSATIGSKGAESGRLMREFAAKVFGEAFDDDAVIEEIRYEQDELFALLGATGAVLDRVPTEADLVALNPEAFDDPAAYLARAAEAWLGAVPPDRVALGQALARSRTLRRLLMCLIGGIEPMDRLAGEVADVDRKGFGQIPPGLRTRALGSLLSLVAHARRLDGDAVVPFLPTQAQLWMRELRRLVRRVSETVDATSFAWSDDAGALRESNYLPIAHCRECGVSGFAAVEPDQGMALEGSPQKVGAAYLEHKHAARYIVPGTVGDGPHERLCPGCLRLGTRTRCTCGEQTFAVTVARERTNGGKKVFSEECPHCGTRGELSILGARAASLSTVAVANLFLTPFNEDKKLLAFTDSVQDASHLAGFFGSRAYRFNLRTAIHTALDAAGAALGLPDIAPKMVALYTERLGVQKMVATFLPPDLADLEEARVYLAKPKATLPGPLAEKLLERLGWEVTIELGYSAGFGRTLENAGCAAAFVDADRMERAAHALALDLAEDATLGDVRPPERRVRAFLEGLVERLRLRGGVLHPFLDKYLQGNGRPWALLKRVNPLMSPFPEGAIGFRFLVSVPHDVFDTHQTDIKGTVAWTRDWASRAFGLERVSPAINLLYRKAVHRLVTTGILAEVPLGAGHVAGLVADAVHASKDVTRLGCDVCRRERVVAATVAPARVGEPCPAYRCLGLLTARPTPPPGYYARRYGSGRLERVFTAEHTGLLDRAAREDLETRFKDGTTADAPNLLVCTPTLEMGIDIGNLSATLMCRTPPSAASYLQRVGRAGRRTGNAFILSMAHARPHDMCFFAEPRTMMAGTVTPPGCFLDAPEILKRQIIAHALDAWAKQATADDAIPGRMGELLGAVGRRRFPGRFLEFYDANAEALLDRFFGMFGAYVGEGTKARLRELATPASVRTRLDDAFRFVEEELDVLQGEVAKVDERRKELDADPHPGHDADLEREELDSARRVADRMLSDIHAKYPLNVLTDAGVLPNYAFPEPGVTLRSAVRFRAKKGAGDRNGLQTYEYVRPASAAIRELAPFNTFYAEGRRVVVTQIDLGTPKTPLTESWRFCRACSHVERENADRPEPSCPFCGDVGWPDVGQLRRVVNFKRSSAISDAVASATTDDTEDRKRENYRTLDLIEVRPENVEGARVIEDLPFGIEMLTRVKLREVNFGRDRGQDPMDVAGESNVSAAGFVVCKDCGRVEQDVPVQSGSPLRIDHAPTCAYRKGKRKEERKDAVFLFREIQSEALRILLPVSAVNVETERASFQAALLLGLRKKFHGTPSHLLLKTMSEPVAGSSLARRVFLVLYDSVPGGTGYLSELWKEGTFMEVLRLALDALKTCRCRNDANRDGCYGCLFAYAVQRDIPKISSQRATRLLTEILDKAASLRSTTMLSEVSLDSRLESELERRFLAALLDWAAKDGWTVSATMTNGAEAHLLRKDERTWLVEAQVDLDARHGVAIHSRPDFVISPRSGMNGARPLAVFCDGLAFHAMPGAKRGRIEDDVRKRRAIVDSGNYWTMAVTWKDIEAFEAGEAGDAGSASLLAATSRVSAGRSANDKAEKRPAPAQDLPENLHVRDGMALITEYVRLPDEAVWRRAIRGALLTTLTRDKAPVFAGPDLDVVEHTMASVAERCELALPPATAKGEHYALLQGMESAALFARAATDTLRAGGFASIDVTLRLFDEPAQREANDFEPSWRAFLNAFSLLQFHGSVNTVTSEMLFHPAREGSMPPPPTAVPSGADVAYGDAFSLTDSSVHELLRACAKADIPAPEVGLDITHGGRVIATGELVWVASRIAVLLDATDRDLGALVDAGWVALRVDVDPDDVIAAVRAAAKVSHS